MAKLHTVDLAPLYDRWAATPPPLDNVELLLKAYLPSVLGLSIPDTRVCEDHQTPADFYRHALSGEHPRIIEVANRSGGKSWKAANIVWLKARRFPGYQARILAGSGDQAKECYGHSSDFWEALDGRMKGELKDPEPLAERTRLLSGSNYAILTASQKRVRGPHPNDLIIDEADEVDRAIYYAAMSQPMSRHGIPASWYVFSTINYAGGLMEELLREHKEAGWKLITYCWLETCKACRDHNCSTCRIEKWCQRRVKDRDDLTGYIDIEHIFEVYEGLSEETWDSEWCCNLRQLLGAVLKRVNVDRAMVDLSDEKAGRLTAFDPNMRYNWLAADWGYTNQSYVGLFQWDGRKDLRLVAREFWTEKSHDEIVDECKKIREQYSEIELNDFYMDAEDPYIAKALKKAGWNVKRVAFGKWKGRCLEALRLWLQGKGGRQLRINRKLTDVGNALISWHYKEGSEEEKIVKKDDHACDMLLAGMRRFAKDRSGSGKIPGRKTEKDEHSLEGAYKLGGK